MQTLIVREALYGVPCREHRDIQEARKCVNKSDAIMQLPFPRHRDFRGLEGLETGN